MLKSKLQRAQSGSTFYTYGLFQIWPCEEGWAVYKFECEVKDIRASIPSVFLGYYKSLAEAEAIVSEHSPVRYGRWIIIGALAPLLVFAIVMVLSEFTLLHILWALAIFIGAILLLSGALFLYICYQLARAFSFYGWR